MIKSTASADATLRDLAEHLKRKVSESATLDTVREARDANGWPMLFLSLAGAEAAGDNVVAIRMKGIDMVSKDVFGNDAIAYTPHTIEIAYEDTVADELDKAVVIAECAKVGVKLEIKAIAAATAVTEASIDAKAADREIENDDLWPTKGR
jgi:hypothetical protein